MHNILALVVGEQLADGILGSFPGSGCPDQFPEISDGVGLLQGYGNTWSAAHEFDEPVEERSPSVNCVERTGPLPGKTGLLHSEDPEPGLLNAAEHFTLQVLFTAIRFEYCQCPFYHYA